MWLYPYYPYTIFGFGDTDFRFFFFFFFRSNRFDTVKVRLQTSKDGHFKGPLDCVLRTVRVEGVSGLYKGATPPLVGWMVMDSV